MIEELVSVGSRGGPRGTIVGVYNYPDITLPISGGSTMC